jgi:hypothetical protein
MSYDLQIWSIEPTCLPEALPDPTAWRHSSECWIHEERDWQISILESNPVEPEDVPEGVARALPGIGFLIEIHVQPVTAAARAIKLLNKTANALAKAAHGVVFDPQSDTVTTPSGVKRLMPLERSESASLLSLSWWFERGQLAEEAEVGDLIVVLKATLPEALPRRYGSCEPPEFIYAETGEDHFRAHVRELGRKSILVWYPHPPVANVFLSIPARVGGSRLGYRSAYLNIDVDVSALEQPGWEVAFQRTWRSVSALVRPFYGDVRTLHGYKRSRGRYWTVGGAGGTESHPVTAWWWNGIPTGPVHAVVLGEPYLGLWPEFVRAAESKDRLAFASAPSWRGGCDSICSIGPIPEPIAQPPVQFKGKLLVPERQYPPVWPFETPRLTE